MKNSILPENFVPFLMTEADLRKLGIEEVAYIKKYRVDGKAAWVLHAADGTALAVQNNSDSAVASAGHHDLDLVALH